MGRGEGERLPRRTWTGHENVQVASWRGGALALVGLAAEGQGPEPHCTRPRPQVCPAGSRNLAKGHGTCAPWSWEHLTRTRSGLAQNLGATERQPACLPRRPGGPHTSYVPGG